MGEKKLHYKMYKDGKKFVFAAIATLSFFVFGGGSTVAVHADTTSGNLTAATVASSSSAANSDTTSAASSSAAKSDTTSAASSSAANSDTTSTASSSAAKSDTTSAASSSAASSDTTSAASGSAVKADSTNATSTSDTKSAVSSAATVASSSSAANSDTTSAASSSAANSDTTSLETSSSLPSQISGFTVSVTASDGSTMNNGSSFNLSGQSAHLKAINLGFTLTQDGTLTPGSIIKIPVSISNNASALVSSAISSGTSLDIQGVGTIKYQADDRYGTSGSYIITIGDSFDQTIGKKVIATVTEQPSESFSLVTTDSTQNIVLTIGDNTFTFVPVKRIYEKDTGNYSSSDFAYSPSANQINTGTSIKDPNYVNNMLESNGTDAGDTNIPTGNIINIQRVQTSGSALTSVNLGNYLGNSTLQISEDGTYLIKNDNSADYNFKSGTGVTSLISLPAGTSDADIAAALNKAGKHSGVVINEGNGQYTIAYNIGNVIGDGAYTYHDLYANDDAATQADNAQEVNRTDAVNNQLNQLLSKLNVIQNLGLQSSFKFADGSVTNKLSGTGTQYSVASDGTATKVTSNNISSNTTPSNARAEGQSKVTVHYVDKDGKELATQAYSYGYPAGSSIAAQSPDYQVAPKDIKGYTLVTSDSPVSSLNGKQLTTSETVPFLANDQTVYYVYTKNAPTITTDKKTVNETIHYQGAGDQTPADHTASVDFTREVSTDAVTGEKTYGSWSADQSFAAVTSPVIKGYTSDQAEIGVQTVSGDSSDLDFTVVYTKDAPTKPVNPSQPTTPAKPVNPSQSTTPTKPVQAGQTAATNFVNQRLPQTGENNSQSQTMSFIGILLAMFGSLLGFLGIKKRRND